MGDGLENDASVNEFEQSTGSCVIVMSLLNVSVPAEEVTTHS